MTTSSFPRQPGDWAGVFLLNLGRALVKLGHEVLVLAPHVGGSPKHETMKGVDVFRFRYAWPQSLETLAYGQGMINNVRNNPLRLLSVLPYIIAQGIRLRRLAAGADVVNAHWLIPQGITAAIFRVRFVLTLHGSDVNIGFRGVLGSMLRPIFRFVVKRAVAVTANSGATKRRIESLLPGVEVRIIPMGVDVGLFLNVVGGEDGSVGTAERDKGGGGIKIVSVGRLIPLKGQEYLISALPIIRERLPEVRLLLVGDGPDRERLIKHTRSLGVEDSVEFTGEVAHDEIPRLLGESDIFVLPSVVMPTGETEGLGTVLIEAMAAGLPVIGSAVGGIVDIIEDGENGILVEERSPKAIADAVLKIHGDDDFRMRIVSRGIKNVSERFSWEGIAFKFEELFREHKEVLG